VNNKGTKKYSIMK